MNPEGIDTLCFAGLFFCCALCLYRLARGPTEADRMVAVDILGIVVVGFSVLMAVIEKQEYFLVIAISWALLSFLGTIALAKRLEGKKYDE